MQTKWLNKLYRIQIHEIYLVYTFFMCIANS